MVLLAPAPSFAAWAGYGTQEAIVTARSTSRTRLGGGTEVLEPGEAGEAEAAVSGSVSW
ncbi:hypothetical protein V1460_24610 [Streptomyces sp. SCSIO 30461]|uniref:hypothetical protein n=1 Tax=Streptomyces sp. SCSIO 30461 TaxID=3118085 RepID=UPI0030D59895